MTGDLFCKPYIDCSQCPKADEGTFTYSNLSKGKHYPKDKCAQNCMLFIIKGELLINSEEYPGTILHKDQFILQALGSKIELLALTDVEYITFRFNELPCVCQERYHEIMNQAEAPLTYTPMTMNARIQYLIKDLAMFLEEQRPCGKYVQIKAQELTFLIVNYYPLYELSAFFYPISNIRRVFTISSCRITIR